VRSRGGLRSRPNRRYPPVNNTRAMVLVLPDRAKALEGMRWKPKRKIQKLDMMEHDKSNRKEVSIMSRMVIVIGHFGTGKYLFNTLAQRIEDLLRDVQTEVDRYITETMDSFVLDFMRKDDWIFSSNCNGIEFTGYIRRERFSRRCMLDEVGYDMSAKPYLPAVFRIYGESEKPSFSMKKRCLKKDNESFGEKATEKKSNELRLLSLPMAVYLWRDRRHRRKRICDLRSAPWKLNSDWICDNAWGWSAFECA